MEGIQESEKQNEKIPAEWALRKQEYTVCFCGGTEDWSMVSKTMHLWSGTKSNIEREFRVRASVKTRSRVWPWSRVEPDAC